jgi:hypothetical protein
MNTTIGFYWQPSATDLESQVALLADTGANTVFVPHQSLDQTVLTELRSRGIRLNVDWAIFVGEELRRQFPDSNPIDATGTAFDREDWYVPLCPNHPQVRAGHLAAMGKLLDQQGQGIEALWLDFIRYPVRWEGAQPRLPSLCFCHNCLNLFLHQERADYSPAETRALAAMILRDRREEWLAWKCARITEFVQAVAAEIAGRGLSIQLGIFSLPWRRADYDGALWRVAAQDLGQLAAYVDVFSPMVYHKLCHRPVSWIGEVVEEVHGWTQRPVLPIIQAMDRPDLLSPAELESALAAALHPPALGAMIFTLDPVLQSPEKAAVVRRLFRESIP